jgi:hypothetical protein
MPAPRGDGALEVRAVLGCREGTRSISATDADTEVQIQLEPVVATLEITSEPAGATVRVDGEKAGKTPTSVSLDTCTEHRIVLSRSGYHEWSRQLDLEEGVLIVPATLAADLQPLPKGTLVIPTPPYEVRIELEGGRRLKPGQELSLVAATYRVTFSSEKLMFRHRARVTVPANKTARPSVEFPPLARLTVRAQPSNVTIEVSKDGRKRDLGAPPIIGEELVTGTYNVKCTFKHNGEVQERSVTLSGGDNPPVIFVAGRS